MGLAKWTSEGRWLRYRARRCDVLPLFAGEAGKETPRPGDWWCQKCKRRNMSSSFFCPVCEPCDELCCINRPKTPKVRGNNYPQNGDWGCLKCGVAIQQRNAACINCSAKKSSNIAHI